MSACAPTAIPPGESREGTSQQRAGAPAPDKPSSGVAKPGGRVIVGNFADAKTLNPVLATDVPSAELWNRIYESLIKVHPTTGEPRPGLAETWEVSPDSSALTFTLRDGLTWSDGSPFTGEDVAFTVEAVMRSKKTVRKNVFQEIAGARAYGEGKSESIGGIRSDGNKIIFNLEKPHCPALTDIGLFGIIPKSVFGKYMDPADAAKNLDDAPENNAPPLATGPFTLKEWKPNDAITLARNDRLYAGRPNLDELVFKVYPDVNALAAALKTGEIDVSARVEAKDLEDLRRVEALSLTSYAAATYTYIGWNQLRGGKEFLQSKNVRQALAYGLNVDQVIERIVFGEGTRMLGHTPPVSWAYDPSGLRDYPYDQQKSRQLLEQDGWAIGSDGIYQKAGQRLEFTIVTNSGNKVRETLLQVAVEQYRQIGIDATARTESFEALVDRTNRSRDPKYGEQGGRDFDAVILGWSLSPDPDAYGIWHSSQIQGGQNSIAYSSPAVDAALEQGRTNCAPAARKAAYRAFNMALNEEQPYNFGFAPNTLLGANKRVQGIDPGPFPNYYNGYLWNVDRWSIR